MKLYVKKVGYDTISYIEYEEAFEEYNKWVESLIQESFSIGNINKNNFLFNYKPFEEWLDP